MVTSDNEPSYTERRQYHKVRAIYPDACIRIAPHLYDHNIWVDSPNEFLAQRMVHESYPDLSSTEVGILISAIDRYVQKQFTP